MKLYLMRHGIATEPSAGPAKNDAQRPLTEEGRSETRLVSTGLKRLGVKPDLILASPLVRAYQTAEIVAEVLGASGSLHVCEALAPGGAAQELYKSLRDYQSADDVFLVGHEPDMSELAVTLLWAGPELDMPFKKAGICLIDISGIPPNAPGTLRWFVTPKIARVMAGKS